MAAHFLQTVLPMNPMKAIGLVGGVASGKSLIARARRQVQVAGQVAADPDATTSHEAENRSDLMAAYRRPYAASDR